LSRYKVFIAYKGSTYGKKIASAIAKCIHENGMDPKIALAGAPGEIPSDSQERIFGWIQRCDAFVASNTKGSASIKFGDECHYAHYDLRPSKPFVAVIQRRSRPPTFMTIGSRISQVKYNRWNRHTKCRELVRSVRRAIESSRPAPRTSEGQALPRRVLYA